MRASCMDSGMQLARRRRAGCACVGTAGDAVARARYHAYALHKQQGPKSSIPRVTGFGDFGPRKNEKPHVMMIDFLHASGLDQIRMAFRSNTN